MQEIKCYDTLNKCYVIIQVEDEIAQFLKRSYWKEDMQERRYLKRKVLLENDVEFLVQTDSVLEEAIKNLYIEELKSVLQELDRKERMIIYYVYYKGLTLCNVAERIGVSSSYMSRLLKKVHKKIRLNMAQEL